MVAGCRGALVWLVRDVLDGMLRAGDDRLRWLLPAGIVTLFAVQGVARAGRTWLTRKAAITAEASLRQRLFAHLLTRSPARLGADGVGDRLSRLSHDAGKVRTAMGAAVTVLQRPLSALVLLIAAAFMAPRLFGWSLVGLPVVVSVVVWTGRRTRASSLEHARSLGRMETLARDALVGLRSIQVSNGQREVAEGFSNANQAQVRAALHTTRYRVVGPPLVELAGAVGVAAVIALGAVHVESGELSPGGLVAFLVALGLLNEPLKGFAVAHALWSDARGALERVFEELDARDPSSERPDAVDLQEGPVTITLRGLRVDRGRGPILDCVDLTLRPGEVVLLRGANGSGKSTLVDVIAGFCAYEGSVEWNGTEAQSLRLASRRGRLALVDQRPWLGVGSLLDSVRLGTTAGRAEGLAALEAVGLGPTSRLMKGLSAGPDTLVGDSGEALSGGETQRIALARARVRDAPLLLLDEPAAHLDPDGARALYASLRGLAAGRTVLIVSHLDSAREIADRVLTLADGRVVETQARAAS